jgi:hypothetical protein
MRSFAVLLAVLLLSPVAAKAMCWDAPCIPPVKCCICPCPNMIGAGSLDDPSKKDRNQLILEQPSEELAENNMSLPSDKELRAIASQKEPEISTVR